MDWIKSEIEFSDSSLGSLKFTLVHFDSIEAPIVPSRPAEDLDRTSLERAQDLLGSVLWLDAVSLFLPFLCHDIRKSNPRHSVRGKKALLLGEGTGACGSGLAATQFFDLIITSDLPDLLPLLRLNAELSNVQSGKKIIEARPVDWINPSHVADLHAACDYVIGCEVLYGNRFVWSGLLKTITSTIRRETGIVYICVTQRNKRHDLDDFSSELRKYFESVEEFILSDNVSVIKASHIVL